MTARDWFVLALRIVGVILLLYGLRDLLDHLLYRLGYFAWPEVSPLYYVIMGVVQIAAGLYLVRGAPLVTGLAFAGAEAGGGEEEEEEGADEEGAAGKP